MSAREIIEQATAKACGVGNLNGLTVIVGKERELIEVGLRRLEAAGYRLIPPGSLDRETIEKCAALAGEAAKERFADGDPEGAGVIEDLAAAIRALGAEK